MVDKHIYSNKMYVIEAKYLKTKRLGYTPLVNTLDSYSEHFDFVLAEGQRTFFYIENYSTLKLVILPNNH